MNKRNPAIPSLPSGMVKVEKGPFQEVVVGIVNGSRIPAFGFDVDGMPPNHWRHVEFGQFGVLIGARQALEVRVILDGDTILETKLYPSDPPAITGLDPQVRAMMAESPQPHFLTRTNSGEPFMFKAHDTGKSVNQIIADQIHPGAFEAPPSIDMVDNAAPVTEELKVDIDLNALGLVPVSAPEAPDNAPKSLEGTGGVGTADGGEAFTGFGGNALASAEGEEVEASAPVNEPLSDEAIQAMLDAEKAAGQLADANDGELPEPHEVLDGTTRSRNWAPSNGLVAVGIRMLQVSAENEPVSAPDAFTYVLFQLNPWNVHTAARNKLTRRIIMPTQEQMASMMAGEGLGEVPSTPRVQCACSRIGPHSH